MIDGRGFRKACRDVREFADKIIDRNIFFLLARHPNVMKKLREEILSTCGTDSELSRDSLRRLPYLQNVLKEVLRLYPSVPVNILLIPKGSAVAFSVYAMHRRPDLYGVDAELFRPERWDEEMPLQQQDPTNAKWGYLPFHGGPRTCLGTVELVGVEKQVMTLVISIKDGCNVEIGQ
ncbi:hypothetical protein J4E86_001223 [Alternaria arbusti]|uniref:uncharacterized protein n=1 Tax=Alternaria arbusti TaxID=232088 RepID=UPI00221EA69A|nr:uncharacterized protein J4E86_001223 [Alternaria arbusti]KAI4962191.1 hypothetical protein J4E86_001223 [Alternaria arbusti]